MKNYKESIEKIANHYGELSQTTQLMEECGELIQAANKYLRAKGNGQRTSMSKPLALANLTEEMADVFIVMSQIQYLAGIKDTELQDYIDVKIQRQLERIDLERG